MKTKNAIFMIAAMIALAFAPAATAWEKSETSFLASVRHEPGKPTKIHLVPLAKGFYSIESENGATIGSFTATRADGQPVKVVNGNLIKATDPTTITITVPAYFGKPKVVRWVNSEGEGGNEQ
jgi:hypothetical protein